MPLCLRPSRQSGLARFLAAFGRYPLGDTPAAPPPTPAPARPPPGPVALAWLRERMPATFGDAEQRARAPLGTPASALPLLTAARAVAAAEDAGTNLHVPITQLRSALAAFDRD